RSCSSSTRRDFWTVRGSRATTPSAWKHTAPRRTGRCATRAASARRSPPCRSTWRRRWRKLRRCWERPTGEEPGVRGPQSPHPGGPRGTAPGDEGGADLRAFGRALGRLIAEDAEPTLVVASADLSHVGGYFGDSLALEEPFLEAVRRADEAALAEIDGNDPE